MSLPPCVGRPPEPVVERDGILILNYRCKGDVIMNRLTAVMSLAREALRDVTATLRRREQARDRAVK